MAGNRRKIVAWLNARIAVVLAIAMVILAAAGEPRCDDMTSKLLVATRDMPDTMFQRTVILIVPSTQEPLVAGVIINQPTEVPLAKLYQDAARNKNEMAFFGGPVETEAPSLILRAATPPEKSSSLLDDIYLSTDTDAIARLLKRPDGGDMRLILGRAQWLKEQLQTEIAAGAWYVVPAKADLIFSDPKSLWPQLVARGELMEASAISKPIATLEGPFRALPLLTIFDERNDPLGFQPQWKKLFPDTRQVVVEKGNHFPMCDDPELVSESIRSWYRECV
jgi:putative AlgH/UPF0301 family transcriptional regulator